ncbi:hypothetical protein PGT21_003932 [Puccinia graminis f. sp. tritici]|uniref:Uncharacterized protein n=1 Tax=Puccinia graminis f. sp. tritici TaxID=56615 RepID=A0A5B0MTN5_PUCGR|nr:hypothetical protein PGT21_003932 [Puccinia graminis f. sp. tritici]
MPTTSALIPFEACRTHLIFSTRHRTDLNSFSPFSNRIDISLAPFSPTFALIFSHFCRRRSVAPTSPSSLIHHLLSQMLFAPTPYR